MKRVFRPLKTVLVVLTMFLLSHGLLKAQSLTSVAPNGVFTADDIAYWVGEGSKEAAFVLVFNDGMPNCGNALVWGFRWDGNITFWEMIEHIAAADPRFFAMSTTGTIGGFGFDFDSDGGFFLHNNYDNRDLYPNADNIFWVVGEDYDDWVAGNSGDRWVSGWFNGFWFISTMYTEIVAPNSWNGAAYNDFSGTFPLNETLDDAEYTAVEPPAAAGECVAPTSLTINDLGSDVYLTWEVVAGAYNYKVYRDGEEIAGEVSTNSFVDRFVPDGEYCYQVQTVCADGASELSENQCIERDFEMFLNPETGYKVATVMPEYNLFSCFEMGNNQLWGNDGNEIVCLDLSTGNEIATYSTPGGYSAFPSFITLSPDATQLWAGFTVGTNTDDRIYRLTLSTGVWQQFGTFSGNFDLEFRGNDILLSGTNSSEWGTANGIYLFDQNGNNHRKIIETGGYSAGIAVDNAGNVYYGTSSALYRWNAAAVDAVINNPSANFLTVADAVQLSDIAATIYDVDMDAANHLIFNCNDYNGNQFVGVWNGTIGNGANYDIIATVDDPFTYTTVIKSTGDITVAGDENNLYVMAYAEPIARIYRDYPPVVINPLEDLVFDQNAPDYFIDLTHVFSDPDDDDNGITKSVANNSNPNLLTASVSGNTLSLTFAYNTSGSTVITIEAVSNGIAVEHSFTVTVNAGTPLVGPFAPAVGEEGSTAIHKDSNLFVGWATGIELKRGYTDIANPTTLVSFGYPAIALGMPHEDSFDVVSLGDGGVATLTFDRPIVNGVGYDFAVFENSFNDTFLELAFVEVSSDGERFVRFPAISLTPTDVQVGSNGEVDPTFIHNFAGKYRQGYGTPFDLDDIADSTGIDLNNIRFVRVIDVVGTINPLYATYDCQGNIVNDPYPTNSYSGGFDLDAVGIINAGEPYAISNFNDLTLNNNSYWDGSDLSGEFQSGIMQYLNDYNTTYYSWNGFGYSNMTDNTTAGYENQFSAYTRGGMDAGEEGGTNYGVGYVGSDWESGTYDPIPSVVQISTNESHIINGCYVTNSTYAYLSMRDGDLYSKKFGGTSGNDPDWFKLIIRGVDEHNNLTDPMEFYLADFRFADNSQDYIVDNWRWLDLTALGRVKALQFTMASSDASEYGINTPTYFCIDNLSVQTVEQEDLPPVVINPIADVEVMENAPDYTIDLTNVFSDPDGDEIVKTIQANSNESLVTATISDNTLTLSFAENNHGNAQITVLATANGLTITDAFTVTVTPAPDEPPVVVNPIDDVVVTVNAPDYTIDLTNVFSDPDGDEIVKTVKANSNPSLLTANIAGNTLTLSFAANMTGVAAIVIEGNANGLTVIDNFMVTVNPATDEPPVVINPIADVDVMENAPDYTIDLSEVFSDPDGDELTFAIISNTNENLVTTSISGNTLTLSFAENSNGTADIVVEATANGQSVTDEFTVIVQESAISELSGSAMQLFPNPTTGIFTISTERAHERVEVYNLAGQRVWQSNQAATEQVVDLSGCVSGGYVVVIYAAGERVSRIVVKE